MEYIEEKTPKGITIKVILKKWKFIAFDKNGNSIYAGDDNMNLMHKVPLIIFLGTNFQVKHAHKTDISLLKVSKGELVVPYTFKDTDLKGFLYINYNNKIDQIPARLVSADDMFTLVNWISTGIRPDYIIVDKNITRDDILVIKNRCPTAGVVMAGRDQKIKEEQKHVDEINPEAKRRAVDILKEVDINIISNNPVFLARIHLRKMDLSRVKQLLLDFDLSEIETQYIMSFLDTMLAKSDMVEELKIAKPTLVSLRDSLQFYIYLLRKDDANLKKMIEQIPNKNELAYFSTLLAKRKLLFNDTNDQLLFTNYENLIYDSKERLKG
jgi:hypothetical protein